MKKTLFLPVLLLLAFYSFAQDIGLPNNNLFIEGTAAVSAHRTFFMENFTMEATSLGFNVVNNRAVAGYIFRFDAQRDEDGYIVLITLIATDDNSEIVSFGWPYADIDEMYEYNQYVLFKAIVLIPGIDEDTLQALMAQGGQQDVRWRNKWLYFRLSFDFPITFYQLISEEDMIGGTGIFNTKFPEAVSHIDNKVVALPAATFGIELHLLPFLSIEPKFTASWEHLNDIDFINLIPAVDLKFPLKLRSNVVLSPYGSFAYPLFLKALGKSEEDEAEPPETETADQSLIDSLLSLDSSAKVYESFPMFGVGGGLQINIKVGSIGAFVFDVNYMYYWGETGIYNQLVGIYDSHEVIKYQRSVIGLGVGFKFGLFNKKNQK